ncbi:MAG: hypothetical protein BGO78_00725 [Chloroflexi bacterium 44-23]|nr:MAG: hypothetical protein BGO78_00725 [Chloroflexi bacterium 44-23]
MSEMNPGEVTSDDRLMAALAYIFAPLVPIIFLFLEDKKNRPFIKAHNGQALVMGVIMIIITPIIAAFTFGCGGILWLLMLWWGYKAYKGEYINIPVVTDFVKNQGW